MKGERDEGRFRNDTCGAPTDGELHADEEGTRTTERGRGVGTGRRREEGRRRRRIKMRKRRKRKSKRRSEEDIIITRKIKLLLRNRR